MASLEELYSLAPLKLVVDLLEAYRSQPHDADGTQTPLLTIAEALHEKDSAEFKFIELNIDAINEMIEKLSTTIPSAMEEDTNENRFTKDPIDKLNVALRNAGKYMKEMGRTRGQIASELKDLPPFVNEAIQRIATSSDLGPFEARMSFGISAVANTVMVDVVPPMLLLLHQPWATQSSEAIFLSKTPSVMQTNATRGYSRFGTHSVRVFKIVDPSSYAKLNPATEVKDLKFNRILVDCEPRSTTFPLASEALHSERIIRTTPAAWAKLFSDTSRPINFFGMVVSRHDEKRGIYVPYFDVPFSTNLRFLLKNSINPTMPKSQNPRLSSVNKTICVACQRNPGFFDFGHLRKKKVHSNNNHPTAVDQVVAAAESKSVDPRTASTTVQSRVPRGINAARRGRTVKTTGAKIGTRVQPEVKSSPTVPQEGDEAFANLSPEPTVTGERYCLNCVGSGVNVNTFTYNDVTYPYVTNSIYSTMFPAADNQGINESHDIAKKSVANHRGPPPIHLVFLLSLFMGLPGLERFVKEQVTLSENFLHSMCRFVIWLLPTLALNGRPSLRYPFLPSVASFMAGPIADMSMGFSKFESKDRLKALELTPGGRQDAKSSLRSAGSSNATSQAQPQAVVEEVDQSTLSVLPWADYEFADD